MKKIIAFAAVGAMFQGGALAAGDPVAEFELLLKTAQSSTASEEPVYLNQYRQKWAKRKFTTSDVKYDVKKTESLVSPIVGVVSLNLTAQQSELLATKEEAQAATDFVPTSTTNYRVPLHYSYKNTKWDLAKATHENTRLRLPALDVSDEDIRKEPNAVPNAALLYWLPK